MLCAYMSLPLASRAMLMSLNPAGGGVYGATGCTASSASGSNGCLQTFVPGASLSLSPSTRQSFYTPQIGSGLANSL